jgi:hypothetical protein
MIPHVKVKYITEKYNMYKSCGCVELVKILGSFKFAHCRDKKWKESICWRI